MSDCDPKLLNLQVRELEEIPLMLLGNFKFLFLLAQSINRV